MKEQIVLYERSDGLLCYELRLTYYSAYLGQFTAGLVDGGLAWYWESEWPGDPAEAQSRKVRNLTKLDSNTADSLRADIEEAEDGYRRFFSLIGLEAKSATLSQDRLRDAIGGFLDGRGPVCIVVVQVGDQATDLVFVRADAPTPVSELLAKWGIQPGVKYKRRRYSQLRSVRLELLYGLAKMVSFNRVRPLSG